MTPPSQPITAVRNIANFAVDLVTALGSDTVFSLTGGMAMHLNRAVAAHPTLKAVYCQHEQAVVAAAEGYAKAADFRKAGFAIVTAGPGVSNSVTSLISAHTDSTPLIVLAGQIKTADIDRWGTRAHGAQEVHSRELITPCVKRFERIQPDNFQSTLIDTFAEAFRGRPGVVFIEFPLDIQGMPFEYDQSDIVAAVEAVNRRIAEPDGFGSSAKIVTALETLLAAERPLLYLGNGVRAAGVQEHALKFARTHSIPCVFSWLSEDVMPASDPLFFGCPGGFTEISANRVLFAADTILILGGRLDLGTTGFQRQTFGNQAHRIVVDVDQPELDKFGDLPKTELVRADLHALPQAIAGVTRVEAKAASDWLPWCQKQRGEYLAEEERRMVSDKMNVYNITRIFNRWADNKTWIPASSGYAEETFSRFFQPGRHSRFFNGASLGSMGLGLAHSIGASFISSSRICCLEADGGLMLNIQELATLSHYSPRGFVIFLLNNNGYESIRASQTRYFGGVAGVDASSGLYIPAYDRICAAFGIAYKSVRSLAELEALLPTLAEDAPPILVDMHIEQFEYRGPAVKTVIDAEGRPSSTPLADLDW
jgi:acetolactate synthase I/II/III large subunit